MTEIEIAHKIVKEMMSNGSLPALTENVSDICSITDDSDTGSADLAAVIMRDCGLTANLLTTANSIMYSPRYPIKTVSGAVTFLGFEKVRALALGLAIFKQSLKSFRTQSLIRMYANSYFSGSFAMSLAMESNVSEPEEVFVAGLLHQLPRMALANTYPEEYKRMTCIITEIQHTEDNACLEVFGASYKMLCQVLAEVYNLPGTITEVLTGSSSGKIISIINEATAMANMLFSDTPGGKEELQATEQRVRNLTCNPNFSVPKFIQKTCNQDGNMKTFFNMEKDDIEIMVKLLEWGKVNPASVASRMNFEAEDEEKECPDVLIGHYLTEMMMIRKREGDLNKVLMLGQEALYKCLPDSYIFMSFIEVKLSCIKAKFYAGDDPKVKAADFKVSLNKTKSPLINCLKSASFMKWAVGEGDLALPMLTHNTMELNHAIFAPIMVGSSPIGLYFAGRKKSEPEFTSNEEIWLEEIAEQVGRTFESIQNMRHH